MKKFFVAIVASFIFAVPLLPSFLFAADPSKDPFYTMGHEISGIRTFDQMYENVDPFSGYVTLSNTDLILPGNGGLDVKIIRTYNSGIWGRRDISNPGLIAWNDWSPLGIGWSMHMGIVRNPSGQGSQSYAFPDNPVVEMPDGSQHTLYVQKNASPNMITREYWIYKSLGGGVYTLTLGDGTVYTFEYNSNAGYIDHAGVLVAQVTSIKNPAGTATISIHYYKNPTDGYSYLNSITDSVGRNVQFNYNYTTHTLTSITVNNTGDSRTFSYAFQTINTGSILGNQNFLITVTPPTGGGSPWRYSYYSSANTYDLQTVTYPAGGTITYSYNNEPFDTGISDVPFRVVTQRTTGGSNSSGTIPSGTWTYAYSTGGSSGNITNITGPGGLSEVHTFNAWGNNCPSAGPCSNIWKIGLPMSKEVKMNGSRILYETYDWSKGTQISNDYVENGDWNSAGIFIYDNVYLPFMSSKIITRDNATYTTTYSSFDTYGNPGSISETGDKTRNTSPISYWTNTSKNIVKGKPSSETVYGSFSDSFSTSYTYDSNSGNVTQMTKYGVTTNYYYDTSGNLDHITDANSKTTYYNWSNGRISQIQPPESGTTINRVINSNGTIASETNGRSYTTSFTYDGILRLKSISPPSGYGNTTNYTYSADNSTKTETRGNFSTNYYYDGFGRPAGTSDSKGIATDIEYKSYEVKDYSTSNIGDRTNFDYFGRPTSIVHQDSTSIGYAYSGSDVTVTDEATHSTHLYYNAFGNPDEKWLDSVTDANNTTFSYDYNMVGSLTSITQGATPRGTYTFNNKNFLAAESTLEKGSITYGRDNVGNMTSKRDDALGNTVYYGYDNNYRLKTITYGSNTVTFGYDGANNRTSMDSPGASIDYAYDGANRLTTKSETIATRPYTTSYSYDGNDNLTTITYPSSRVVTYGHDAKNQVISATGFGGSITPVSYCSTAPCIGLPSSFTASSGRSTSFQYTSRNLTSRITTSSSVSDVAYGYTDNRGNMTSLIDYVNVSPSRNQSMTYDNLNRLWTFNGSWGSGSFSYLASGDRSLKSVAGANSSYTYSNNRLTSTSGSGGEAATFGYNSSGDLTSLNGVSLTIDMLHNVTSYNGTPVVSFAYDGDGMRVTKSSSGNTVVYHYDKEGRLLSEDGSGVLIADYIYLHGKLAAKVVNTFTVSATAGAHGSLDPSTPSPQTVNYNGTATFVFNANTGYHVASVSGCGGSSYANTDNSVSSYSYTTGPITADCNSVNATFAINQYKVTPSSGAGGYFTPATQQTVNYNATTSFTVNPNSGYHIVSIGGCGSTTVGVQATNASYVYTTVPITVDCTVSATFSNTFTVSASAGTSGSLDTSYRTSPQTVTYSGNTSFKFNAATGYHVANVSGCNGTPYNNTSNGVPTYTYTTGAITADCTVSASFAVNTYSVSASAGPNGSLDASTPSPKTINHGGSTAFKFVAATGYHVSGISGCWGTPYTNTSNTVTMYTYSTGSIVGDCTVQATFAINEYQVTATAGQNGSLSASTPSPQTISYNGTTSFTFDSNTDYHIGTIEGCWGTPYANTAPAVTNYSYSTGPITADCTVTATFVINPPVASFTFVTAPASGKAPLRAEFTDTTTPPASQWDWEFGDGAPHSHEQNPVHVYEGSGTFTVTLAATNDGGPSVPPATQSIDVLACDNPQTVKLSSLANVYTTISAALIDANPGDTIQSQALHFPENVTVDKDITLDGGYDCDLLEKVGNTTIKGATAPSLSIDAGSVTIDGISVE